MPNASTVNYGLEDKPPLLTTLFLGFQHAVMLTAMFVFPILIISAAHGSLSGELHMIQACMFTMGLGTILLAMNNRFFGSGYLASPINDPAFFPLSMMAVKIGGLPLLYTINYVQSFLQIACSELLVKFRKYFPMEVTGLVIFMIGISIITSGITNAIGGVSRVEDVQWDSASVIISFSSLLIMVGFTVWGGRLAKYGLLFGIIWGCLLAVPLHRFGAPDTSLHLIKTISFPLPVFFHVQIINWDLVLPILVAVVAVSLKAMGGLITLQKINDPTWACPDLVNIRKGLLTTGFCSLISTSLGGMPLGVSSINVGLEMTTHCTSRRIAWALGAIMIVLSFFPKVNELFVLLPKGVMGAMMIFVISSLLIAGVQIMLIPLMTSRRLFVIGIPITIGLTFEFMPQLQHNMPLGIQMLVASPLTSATLLALLLNFFATLGNTKKAEVVVNLATPYTTLVSQFVSNTSTTWQTSANVEQNITNLLNNSLLIIKDRTDVNSAVTIKIDYDGFTLRAMLSYSGKPIDIKQDFTNLKVWDIKSKTHGDQQELKFFINT